MLTSMTNMNLWKRTVKPPDTGNDKPDLENDGEVPQVQAEVLLQEPSSGLDSHIGQAIQASLSVGFGKT
jgi:hypothetical protein